MKTIHVGVLGGGRTGGLAGYLAQHEGVVIHGGYDPRPERIRTMLKAAKNPDGGVYASDRALIADPAIDWVMVGSPNAFHRPHIVAAFQAGKHVFAEKPLATTIEDCLAIVEAHRHSGKLFATGFNMRYTALYREAKRVLDSGALGRIVSIDGNENINPGHGAYIMANWRRNKALAGPHILEKCVHDMDMLLWLTGSLPRRVAAFGGTDFFVPENQPLLQKSKAFFRLQSEWDPGVDPFTAPKDIEDNLVAILEFYSGARAQFQATTCNTLPERRLYLNCTEGNLIVEQYAALLKWQALGDPAPHVFHGAEFHDAHLEGYQKVHADGDRRIMAELAESMRRGAPPQCGGLEGLRSAAVAIMLDRARIEGRVLDLTETWQSLGVLPETWGSPRAPCAEAEPCVA